MSECLPPGDTTDCTKENKTTKSLLDNATDYKLTQEIPSKKDYLQAAFRRCEQIKKEKGYLAESNRKNHLENGSSNDSEDKKSTQCRFCHRTFANFVSRRHHEIHHSEMTYKCPTGCPFMFLDFCNLQSHCKETHNVYLKKSDGIKCRIKRLRNLIKSLKRDPKRQRAHSAKIKVIWPRCKWCKRAFKSKILRDNHEADHSQMRYSCSCGYYFENYSRLYRHSAVKHAELLDDDYERKCSVASTSEYSDYGNETMQVEDYSMAALGIGITENNSIPDPASDDHQALNLSGNMVMLTNPTTPSGEVAPDIPVFISGGIEAIQSPLYVKGIISVPQQQVHKYFEGSVPSQVASQDSLGTPNNHTSETDGSNLCNEIVKIIDRPVAINEIVKMLAGPISVKHLIQVLKGPVFENCNMEIGEGITPGSCNVRIEGDAVAMNDFVSEIGSSENQQHNVKNGTVCNSEEVGGKNDRKNSGFPAKKKPKRKRMMEPCLQRSKKRRKKVKCSICKRPFKSIGHRNYHLEHHAEMRYRCPDFCGFQFEDFAKLRVHYQNTHRAKLSIKLEKKCRLHTSKKRSVGPSEQRKLRNNLKDHDSSTTGRSSWLQGNCSVRVAEGEFNSNATVTIEEGSVPSSRDRESSARRCFTGRLHRYKFLLKPEPDTNATHDYGPIAKIDDFEVDDEISRPGSRPLSRPIFELELENVQDVNRKDMGQSSESGRSVDNDTEDFISEMGDIELGDETVSNILHRLNGTEEADVPQAETSEENKPFILQASNLSYDCRYYNFRCVNKN